MKNIEHIKYTYKHRLIVLKLAEKYFEDNKELLERVKYHDIDKLFLYLFYDKKSVSRLHRDLTSHHENDIEKTKLDYMEMILDWEAMSMKFGGNTYDYYIKNRDTKSFTEKDKKILDIVLKALFYNKK